MSNVTLSPSALSLLGALYLAPQRILTNRRSPERQELEAAGYAIVKPVGLIITDAGKAALLEIDRAKTSR